MGRPTRHQKRHENSGRPSKITPDMVTKLEEAFSFGLTDEKACLLVGISKMTLYRFIEKNPSFSDRKEALKTMPDITAQKFIVGKLDKDTAVAQWWMTKKIPEFNDKLKVEGTITHQHTITPEMQASIEAYREAKRLNIINKIRGVIDVPVQQIQ